MPIVRLADGSLRDEIREPQFDTIDIINQASGAAQLGTRRFYQDVRTNTDGSAKGEAETNLRQSNLLETAVSFRIQGLAVDAQNFRDGNELVLPLIMEHSSTKLVVGEKTYWQGPMRYTAGRIRANFAGQADSLYQQFGDASVVGTAMSGHHAIDIPPLQNFFVEWKLEGVPAAEQAALNPAANTKIRFVSSLKGLKRRPVQ